MPKNAIFHQKLVLLLKEKLFKICHWVRFWYIRIYVFIWSNLQNRCKLDEF